MENIKYGFSLSGEFVSQQFSNNMNENNIFEVTENPADDLAWVIDGVAFPSGTEFSGSYKGYYYQGKVNGGALIINGKKFLSPSAAAITITRIDVDGWLFWDCKFPGMSSWTDIYSLRVHSKIS